MMTRFVGHMNRAKLQEMDHALAAALDLELRPMDLVQ
jgi:hypothetical protein